MIHFIKEYKNGLRILLFLLAVFWVGLLIGFKNGIIPIDKMEIRSQIAVLAILVFIFGVVLFLLMYESWFKPNRIPNIITSVKKVFFWMLLLIYVFVFIFFLNYFVIKM